MVSYFRLLLQPCAIVSVCMSLCVVLTALVFPQTVQRKIFMQLVVLISVCDVMGNWPYMLGFNPGAGTALCAFESFCNLYFFPVSWVLTAMLTKLCRDVLVIGTVSKSRLLIFGPSLFCPLIVTLGYLAVDRNAFNIHDDDSKTDICTYAEGVKLYHIITYNVLLLVCIAFMLVMLLQILSFELRNQDKANRKVYVLVKRIVILYPFALLICWIPHAICLFVQSCYSSFSDTVQVDTIKILHGGIVALIYFIMNGEARTRWYELSLRTVQKNIENGTDMTTIVPAQKAPIPRRTHALPDDDTLVAGMKEIDEDAEGRQNPIFRYGESISISPMARSNFTDVQDIHDLEM